MDNQTIFAAVLWVAAGAALILLIARRRKRKMSEQ
jgi:hypothetical protein